MHADLLVILCILLALILLAAKGGPTAVDWVVILLAVIGLLATLTPHLVR